LSQIILFAISPEKLVGLSSKWRDGDEEYIAEEYLNLPYTGQLFGSGDLNVEELASLNPQVIIDVGEAKESLVQDLDTLQAETSIPCIHIDATLETMPQAFEKLGQILGNEEHARKLSEFCQSTYDQTVSIMESVGDNKARAIYLNSLEGLAVIAKGSYHAQILDLLTDNLAITDNPSAKGTGNEVTPEQIALWNPDYIILSPDCDYEEISNDPVFQSLDAIKSGNYLQVPQGPHNWMGTPPSVQRYLGLIWLTAALYPEQATYDVQAEVTQYYKLFYGHDLTDAQYEKLTKYSFIK